MFGVLVSFLQLLVSLAIAPFQKLYCYIFGDFLLFGYLLPTTFLYNASVEDPRMDMRVLNITRNDHVLTICSAGCNAFDYLIEGARVTAADLNPAQIALAKLKVVAALIFDYKTFFQLFGEGDLNELRRLWWNEKSGLRNHPKLSDSDRAFWDVNLPRSAVRWWLKGLIDCHLLYYMGASGICQRGFQMMLWVAGMLDLARRGCAGRPLPDDFQKVYRKGMKVIKLFFRLLRPLITSVSGVPERQYDLMVLAVPNLVDVFFDRVAMACILGRTKPTDFSRPLPEGNYFFHAFLYGRYRDQTACPRYLQADHFTVLRQALLENRFTLFTGRLEEAAKQAVTRRDGFTVFSLLDSMDWMTREEATNMLAVLFAAADPAVPLARVFWRSGSPSFNLPALCYTSPQKVDDSDDRLGSYLSTWVGSLPTSPITYDEAVAEHSILCKLAQPSINIQDKGRLKNVLNIAKTCLQICAFPVRSALQATNKGKSDRDSLLVAGPLLMQYIRAIIHRMSADRQNDENQGKLTWVDIGGGSLQNLEYLGSDLVSRYIQRIWVVGSAESLAKSQEEIDNLGLSDIVQLVTADVSVQVPSKIASLQPGSADIVTLSYSLSTVQPPEDCIERVVKWLAPGGVLGVGDLTTSGEKASDRFARWWFRKDGIDLNPSVRSALSHKSLSTPMFTQWPERAQGLPFVIPNHYVQIAYRRNSSSSIQKQTPPTSPRKSRSKRRK